MKIFLDLRQDCINASSCHPDVLSKLEGSQIAVTGGTGFLGSWIAEMVAALNDEYDLKIKLDLYARDTSEWIRKWNHLSRREDIKLYSQDVRSPFKLNPNTNFVVHAAGTPNNRVHASDPLRVVQTTISGISNTLDAANELDDLKRFINVSSALVAGKPNRTGALSEDDFFPIPSGQFHMAYVDAKRSAESIATIYRSQLRMPISTIRPFTFIGPYQSLDRPWAINNFINDARSGRDIRILGDGSARRSYLYGSDAAWWILSSLINGRDGLTYSLGSSFKISHIELAQLISQRHASNLSITTNTEVKKQWIQDDFYPNTTSTEIALGVTQTCNLQEAIEKTWRWFSIF